uniref:DnaJ homolog subfamily C member 7 n=2 Tax=Hirondellea gigas TaxID=1518452 RepID=A0A6A7GAR4_9CRUS
MCDEKSLAQALQKKQEGNDRYKNGDYDDAVALYSEAIQLSPTTVAFYGNRAAAFMMLGSYSKCTQDCHAAIEIDPSYGRAYSRGASCHIHLGELHQASSLLNRLKQLSPDDGSVNSELQRIDVLLSKLERFQECLDSQRHDAALSLIKSLLVSITDSMDLKLKLCEILLMTSRINEAMKLVGSLHREEPSNIEALRLKGLAFYYNQNIPTSLKILQQVLRHDPDNSKARENYKLIRRLERTKSAGNDAFKAGRLDEAYNTYSECLQIDPLNRQFNSVLANNRAAACLKLKRYEDAFADCNLSLELNPGFAKAYIRRASARQGLEEFDEAVKDCELAVELDGNNQEFQRALRDAKFELKKSQRINYYKVLCVDKDASERDIKKAYRKLALKWHPDKSSLLPKEEQNDSEQKFKDIGNAYSILSDPKKRARYDSGADMEDGGGMGGVDPSQVFQMFFGGGGGARGGGGMPPGFEFRFG